MPALRVDKTKCIKAGECYYNHPALFKVDKEGFPTVLIEQPGTPALIDEAQAARDVCPGQAIILED
jgi:ferredoxin